MSREPVPEKAARLLASGAVHVRRVDGNTVAAVVIGDTGTYEVGFDGERWACSCSAWEGCSHAAAVELCTTPVRVAVAA